MPPVPGVAASGAGDLFVTDAERNCVLRATVDATGRGALKYNVTTVACNDDSDGGTSGSNSTTRGSASGTGSGGPLFAQPTSIALIPPRADALAPADEARRVPRPVRARCS